MRPIKKGSTDQSTVLRFLDSASGIPTSGVVYNTSGLNVWYRREGAVKSTITTTSLSALNDAHSDGGFLHISDGYYRVDLPDAAVSTGANGVLVGGSSSGVVVVGTYHPLVDYDPQDSTSLGLSALPKFSPGVSGGMPTVDSNNLIYGIQPSGRNDIVISALKLNFSGITGEAERSMLNALRFLRNKWSISGTTLTVYKEDDFTTAWSGAVSTNASSDPVTGNDPT